MTSPPFLGNTSIDEGTFSANCIDIILMSGACASKADSVSTKVSIIAATKCAITNAHTSINTITKAAARTTANPIAKNIDRNSRAKGLAHRHGWTASVHDGAPTE